MGYGKQEAFAGAGVCLSVVCVLGDDMLGFWSVTCVSSVWVTPLLWLTLTSPGPVLPGLAYVLGLWYCLVLYCPPAIDLWSIALLSASGISKITPILL